MDDVKNQFKGLVKKFNNPFASSSSRFKGEGHRLGNGQNSTQRQPNSQHQQGDWRKLQHERWEREGSSSHPTPLQGRSEPSISFAPDSPSKSSVSTLGSSSLDASSTRHNSGSYELSISDALQAQKIDHAHISDAAITQNDQLFDSPGHGSQALGTQNFDDVLLSSIDNASSSKDEAFDAEKHGTSSDSHASYVTNERLSGDAGVTVNDPQGPDENVKTHMFDPFSPQIGSISSSANSDGLRMFQCPVCESWWRTETEVNAHVDDCLSQNTSIALENESSAAPKSCEGQTKVALGVFLSGGPSSDTVNVFVRIIRNIVNSPDLEKFRKFRLSNPKIHDTVGTALGGVELLEAVGFDYQTQEDEIWAVMGVPSVDQIKAMQMVISELEVCIGGPQKQEPSAKLTTSVQRKVDRQVRVFYAVPENLAAKMELPDSFFQLSAAELRHEAAVRRKKLEDSQLLISKVSREKMAAANKRRYKAAIIRIQFPDGVVLQGMFLPWEPVTAIYEFVSTSLRNPSTQFSLAAPGLSKKQIIPAFADGTTKVLTLEEANLVPAVLVKFQCAESDSLTFTGLHPDVLAMIEPLTSTPLACSR